MEQVAALVPLCNTATNLSLFYHLVYMPLFFVSISIKIFDLKHYSQGIVNFLQYLIPIQLVAQV